MGIADKASEVLNKGVATAGRASRKQLIKAEIKELENQRAKFFEKLGEAIYRSFGGDSQFRASFDVLFKAIDSIELQKKSLEVDLKAISVSPDDIEGDQAQFCSVCGKPNAPHQAFCMFCGAKVEKTLPAPSLRCKNCGVELSERQKFCMRCGTASS